MLWDYKILFLFLFLVLFFFFVYMYYFSYSGIKMILIRFYGYRLSYWGGIVRLFFYDLIVYKGYCIYWKIVKKNYGFFCWGKNF